MGLDIMMYEVVREKDECGAGNASEFILYPETKNKSELRLFEKFKDFVFKKKGVEYLDIEKFKKDNNIDGYEIVEQRWNGDDSTLTFMRYNDDGELDTSTEKVVAKVKDIPVIIRDDTVLKACEVKYQRKGMNKRFYTEVLAGCWYIDNNTDKSDEDSLDFVTTKEEFEKIKQYVEVSDEYDNSILSWNFVEGKHFIYFSY